MTYFRTSLHGFSVYIFMLKIGPLAVLSAENKLHFTKSFEILQPMMMEDEEMIKN